MKKILLHILLGIIVGATMSAGITFAQRGESPVQVEGDIPQVGGNTKKCSGAASSFFSAVLDVQESKLYTADLFTKNRCQQDMLLAMYDELSTLADNVTSRYESCDSEGGHMAGVDYIKKKFEIEYFRKILEVNLGGASEEELEEYQLLLEENLDKINQSLINKYVVKKEWLSIETANELLEEYEKKYVANLGKYTGCSEGGWQEVSEKWQEIQDKFASLSPGGDEDASELDKARAEQAKKKKGKGKKTSKDANKQGAFKKFLSERFQKRIEVETPPTINEIASDIKSFQNVYDAVNTENTKYELSLTTSDKLAEYKILYGEVSASSTEGLVDQIRDLNFTLTHTASTSIPNITKCAEYAVGKQK